MAKILFLPDFQVFETVQQSIQAHSDSHPKQLFVAACVYYVDSREKVIYTTQELRTELKAAGIIPKTLGRWDIYQVVDSHSDSIAGDHITAVKRLASLLAIDTDKEIYIVTDNGELARVINSQTGFYKAISSAEAVEKLAAYCSAARTPVSRR